MLMDIDYSLLIPILIGILVMNVLIGRSKKSKQNLKSRRQKLLDRNRDLDQR
jgi:hypothetical protein